MFFYPARVSGDREDGFVVTFPDIPEAVGGGRTRDEALEDAVGALATAMEFYFEDNRPVPLPSLPKRGQVTVALATSIAAKVLLLNRMLEEKVTAAELARRLNMSPQNVTRIVTLSHPTKIDTIADALRALGGRLIVAAE